jgi:hypothetical protein
VTDKVEVIGGVAKAPDETTASEAIAIAATDAKRERMASFPRNEFMFSGYKRQYAESPACALGRMYWKV